MVLSADISATGAVGLRQYLANRRSRRLLKSVDQGRRARRGILGVPSR